MPKGTKNVLIELHNVSRMYGIGEATTVALDNVSLQIDEGDFVAIMGPSGSGKTTLMNLLGLLDNPTHGYYILKNHNVANLNNKARSKLRLERIGFIFQSFNLLNNMTAIDNVALPLAYSSVSIEKRLKKASDILNKLGLKEREYYFPYQLSGGQVQRVAIARALVNKPDIVLADEPTGNLDKVTSENIMSVLKDLNDMGNTIMMVTHSEEVAKYANKIVYLEDGRLVEIGDTKDMLEKEALAEEDVSKSETSEAETEAEAKGKKEEQESSEKKSGKDSKKEDSEDVK